MWSFVIERGPAIAFWLLALAAQLSGYTSAAVALGLVGLALFFLVAPACHHLHKWYVDRRGTMGGAHIVLLIGIAGTWLFLTIALGAAAWVVWHGQGFAIGSSAIAGNADDGPMQGYKGGIVMEGGPLSRLNVFSLKFRGVNVSQKEVQLKDASIISAVNGTKIPLEIIAQGELVPLNQVELIPPGAPVELIAKFGPPDPNAPGKILGLEPKVFLETWRQFSLNIQDDSKSYRLSFNEGDLAPFFPGMVGPHVTKKQ